MVMTVEVKKEVIKKHRTHSNDTGSTEVQIALLTERINSLSGHFQQNPKDYNSRRGLLKMIGHRSALLKYLAKYQPKKYQKLIKDLNIRK